MTFLNMSKTKDRMNGLIYQTGVGLCGWQIRIKQTSQGAGETA